jgi:DNA-binding CsgD family transcriptional regulator
MSSSNPQGTGPQRQAQDDPIATSVEAVAAAAARGALAMFAVTSSTDAAFAAASGGDAVVVLDGVVLAVLATSGIRRAASLARLLRPRGRIVLPVALLPIAGVAPEFQHAYGNTVFAAICLAAVVASPAWVGTCVAISVFGFVGDRALQGYSVHWLVLGGGQADLLNYAVDVVVYAIVMLGAIRILRDSLTGATADLARTRAGADSLTPELAAAVRKPPTGLLGRADPVALVERLSVSERRLVALLADGLAPKQAARELHIAMPTVRSHIAAAKRKTGARTLEQLVALVAEAQHET